MKRYIKASDVADIQAKIAKKQAEIDKKTEWIQKKEDAITKKLSLLKGHIDDSDYDALIPYLNYLKENDTFSHRVPEGLGVNTWGLVKKYGFSYEDKYGKALYNIADDAESIYNSKKAIKEMQAVLDKYMAQLQAKQAQSKAIDEIPECLKDFMNKTVASWDAYDIRIRDDSRPVYRELVAEADKILYKNSPTHSYMDADKVLRELYPDILHSSYRRSAFTDDYINEPFKQEFGISVGSAKLLWEKTDEQIHAENVKAGEALILDLLNRVEDITGTVTDWDGLFLTAGNGGFATINGLVIGEKGKANVKSIHASGPIQRLHIRTLVKPAK